MNHPDIEGSDISGACMVERIQLFFSPVRDYGFIIASKKLK